MDAWFSVMFLGSIPVTFELSCDLVEIFCAIGFSCAVVVVLLVPVVVVLAVALVVVLPVLPVVDVGVVFFDPP